VNSVAAKDNEKKERTIWRGGRVMNRFAMTYPNFFLELFSMGEIQLRDEIRGHLHDVGEAH
jgi:hypothetical protein